MGIGVPWCGGAYWVGGAPATGLRVRIVSVHSIPMNRRQFTGSLAAAGGWAARIAGTQQAVWATPGMPSINGARLRTHLEELSVFGRPAGGTFADGVSRVAYSDADVAGRAYARKLMEAAGLKTRIDAAGNIYGRRAGTDDSLAPVLFGSHIDSVPNGGNFDGDLGSLAAIEVARALEEAGVTTRRPLEVVVWQNEEGYASTTDWWVAARPRDISIQANSMRCGMV